MVNLIWQTRQTGNKNPYTDETYSQFEFITEVIFKNIKHENHFDNKKYSIFLENAIIIYSSFSNHLEDDIAKYLKKYDSMNIKYSLFHLSNENSYVNGLHCDYYDNTEHVFKFYYDKTIKKSNVTTFPLGYISGYINREKNINLSKDRDITTSFIGQVKSDRQLLVNNLLEMDELNNNFVYLTDKWNPTNGLSFNKVIEIFKRTLFVPCPMGWQNPESCRLYEALEWGCIPIIKRYNGEDYYKNILGDHPIPVVNEWDEINSLIQELKSEDLDKLIKKINNWYLNYLDSISNNVENIIKAIY